MRWLCGFLIVVVFAGCTDNQKIPEGIIGKEKMEKIMWDMLQADRYVNTFISAKKDSTINKKQEAAIFYARVFKMHGITSEQFEKSYRFYLGRPDITRVMFDSISTRADKRRADVYVSRRNPFLEKRDSLRRLDSIRQADSLAKIDTVIVDTASTSEMSDSALREMLYK